MKSIDLTGQQFGRLTVVKRAANNPNSGRTQWECLCNPDYKGCGKTAIVPTDKLKNGSTQSCGCFRREFVKKAKTTHGMRRTTEYNIWCGIVARCYNEKHDQYKDYGGRGITMCDAWRESFEAFYRDMGPRPSMDYTIDRKDNDKGYSKENCRWATKIEQQNNTRRSIFYEHDGVYKSLAAWCRELKLDYFVVYRRLSNGMSFEDAINVPKTD